MSATCDQQDDGEVFTDVDEELIWAWPARPDGDQQRSAARSVPSPADALAAVQEVTASWSAAAHLRAWLIARQPGARRRGPGHRRLPDDDSEMMVIEVINGALGTALAGSRFPRAEASRRRAGLGGLAVFADVSSDHQVAQSQVRAGQLGPALFVALVADGS